MKRSRMKKGTLQVINGDLVVTGTRDEMEDGILALAESILADRPKPSLESMAYAEYLHTDHWATLRMVKLDQAKHRCQICYAPEALDVHHRTYKRRGRELDSDLIVLCRDCHTLFHQHGRLR